MFSLSLQARKFQKPQQLLDVLNMAINFVSKNCCFNDGKITQKIIVDSLVLLWVVGMQVTRGCMVAFFKSGAMLIPQNS